jgi:hypothetical protein
LVAIFDIEPDRPAVVMIHARIHGKDQLAAIGRNRFGQPAEIGKRRAVGMRAEQGKSRIVRREPADREGLVLKPDGFASLRRLLPATGKQEENKQGQPGAHGRSLAGRQPAFQRGYQSVRYNSIYLKLAISIYLNYMEFRYIERTENEISKQTFRTRCRQAFLRRSGRGLHW